MWYVESIKKYGGEGRASCAVPPGVNGLPGMGRSKHGKNMVDATLGGYGRRQQPKRQPKYIVLLGCRCLAATANTPNPTLNPTHNPTQTQPIAMINNNNHLHA